MLARLLAYLREQLADGARECGLAAMCYLHSSGWPTDK
jgi:hypothetical protein